VTVLENKVNYSAASVLKQKLKNKGLLEKPRQVKAMVFWHLS